MSQKVAHYFLIVRSLDPVPEDGNSMGVVTRHMSRSGTF